MVILNSFVVGRVEGATEELKFKVNIKINNNSSGSCSYALSVGRCVWQEVQIFDNFLNIKWYNLTYLKAKFNLVKFKPPTQWTANSPDTVLRFKHSFLRSQVKMESLHLLILQLIIYACTAYGGPIKDEPELKPCPKIKPFNKVNIDQVVIIWIWKSKIK